MISNTKKLEWELHSRSNSFRIAVNDAIEIIGRAKNTGIKFGVSWSGGKDSTALTHIVKTIWPECPVISQFDDCDWPEKAPYMDRVSSSFGWDINKVSPDFSVWDAITKSNFTDDSVCALSHWITKDAFIKLLDKEYQKHSCEGRFLGLRKEESIGRKRNINLRGSLYKRKDNQYFCHPLSRWKSIDVFSYHIANDIEINPCYLKNRFKSPEEIRLSWALPTAIGFGAGDMEHIRYYYPEYFRRVQNVINNKYDS